MLSGLGREALPSSSTSYPLNKALDKEVITHTATATISNNYNASVGGEPKTTCTHKSSTLRHEIVDTLFALTLRVCLGYVFLHYATVEEVERRRRATLKPAISKGTFHAAVAAAAAAAVHPTGVRRVEAALPLRARQLIVGLNLMCRCPQDSGCTVRRLARWTSPLRCSRTSGRSSPSASHSLSPSPPVIASSLIPASYSASQPTQVGLPGCCWGPTQRQSPQPRPAAHVCGWVRRIMERRELLPWAEARAEMPWEKPGGGGGGGGVGQTAGRKSADPPGSGNAKRRSLARSKSSVSPEPLPRTQGLQPISELRSVSDPQLGSRSTMLLREGAGRGQPPGSALLMTKLSNFNQ